MKNIFLTLFLLTMPGYSFAEEKPSVTGVYSTLAYHEDSGDLMGMEIHILYSYSGYFAVVQCSGGDPVIVRAEVKENSVSFSLSESDDEVCSIRNYKGIVRQNDLKIKKDGGDLVLPRRDSYWIKRDRVV